MSDPSSSRTLHLAGVANARHLGGLPLAGGGASARSSVVRSARLRDLCADDVEALRALGIRTVIDVREAAELERDPDPDLGSAGVRHIWAPVYQRDPTPLGVHLEHGHAGYVFMYQNYLEYGRAAMVRIVETIAESEGGVLMHCAAGRDRTGLVSAMLLACAGVEEDAILADHALSETRSTLAARGHTGASVEHRLVAPIHAMAEVLAMVRERWGSAEGYLLDAGASHDAVAELRRRARG